MEKKTLLRSDAIQTVVIMGGLYALIEEYQNS